MVLVISIILTVAFFIMAFQYVFDLEEIWLPLGVVSTAITVVMMIIIVSTHCGTGGVVAKYRETYKSLVYKAETEACRDEFGIVNKDYIDEVQSWNEDLSSNKAYQRDFWIGVFVPNIYDEFELIDLDSIKYK